MIVFWGQDIVFPHFYYFASINHLWGRHTGHIPAALGVKLFLADSGLECRLGGGEGEDPNVHNRMGEGPGKKGWFCGGEEPDARLLIHNTNCEDNWG